jgi:hypothetical protein
VSDGAFSEDGSFHPLTRWSGEALMRLFRERVLARLVDKHAISQELAKRLMTWRHPGFSAHVGEPIAAGDTRALENVAGYVTRNLLSLQRLVYLDGQQAVITGGSSTIRPSGGTSRRWSHWNGWREWPITSRTQGAPTPSSTATMPIGSAAIAPPAKRERAKVEEQPAKKRRCSASWARLISKVFHLDPLTCAKCGGKLEIIAYLHDQVSISKILDHLGLSPPRPPSPRRR